MDWIVITNRLALLGSRNRERIGKALRELSARIGFRTCEGLAERVIYREFFPRGLTAVDSLDEKTLGARPRLSHVAARQEVMGLMANLKLRLDERGQQRAGRPRRMGGGARPADRDAGPLYGVRRRVSLASSPSAARTRRKRPGPRSCAARRNVDTTPTASRARA